MTTDVSNFIYTDAERALLQYVMSVGIASLDSLTTVYDKLKKCEDPLGDGTPAVDVEGFEQRKVEDAIDKINDKLHLLGFEISKTKSQDTQDLYYTYINTITDTPSKISTQHSPKEIEVIKRIIEKILVECEDESYIITSSDALKICNRSASFSASEGEHFLKSLVDEGWLNRSMKGRYSLSIRALTELKRTFIEKYGIKNNDNSEGQISLCKGCDEIVTNGVRCYRDACYIKFHTQCQLHYFRAKGTKCPNDECTVDWNEDKPRPVGEKRLVPNQ